jgi:hypothetical protein
MPQNIDVHLPTEELEALKANYLNSQRK